MADSELTIRRLGPADLPLLLATPDGLFDDPIIPEPARQFLDDPRHLMVAAIDADVIVGFASAVVYTHPDKARPELWVNEVGVSDAHQRRGIGKRIMEAMIAEARLEGCSAIWVLTSPDNDAARALYRASGLGDGQVTFNFELTLDSN